MLHAKNFFYYSPEDWFYNHLRHIRVEKRINRKRRTNKNLDIQKRKKNYKRGIPVVRKVKAKNIGDWVKVKWGHSRFVNLTCTCVNNIKLNDTIGHRTKSDYGNCA